MQVELLNSVPVGELMAEPVAARTQPDDSFRDTLEGVREVEDRSSDGDVAEEDATSTGNEEASADTEQGAVQSETAVDSSEMIVDEVVFAPVTTAQAAPPTVVEGGTAVSAEANGPTLADGTVGDSLPKTGVPTAESAVADGPSQGPVVQSTEAAVATTEVVKAETAAQVVEKPVVQAQASAVVSDTRVRPVSDAVVESTTVAPTTEGGPELTIGDYTHGNSADAGQSGKREHTFYMLGGSGSEAKHTVTATTAVQVPVAEAADAALDVQAAPPQEALAPTQVRTEPSSTTAQTVDGTAQLERVENGLRSTPVLRAEAGDEAALTRRIYRLVRRAIRNGDSEVKIRLDPPNLGRVDVEVRMKGDRVDVVFQVDDEQVRSAVAKSLDELERALGDHGYMTDEVTVDLRDAREGNEGETDARTPRGDDDGEELVETERHEVQVQHLGTAMDLRG